MKIFKLHIVLVFLAIACPSITKADTTDNYQIHIKKKLVLNESGLGSAMKNINLLVLKKQNYNESLCIYFNHCMRGTTRRKMQLVDSTEKVILEWNFQDETDQRSMEIPIKEIWQQSDMPFLTLYYYDHYNQDKIFISLIAFEDKNLEKVISTYSKKFKN